MPSDYSGVEASAESDVDRCRSYLISRFKEQEKPSVRAAWPPPGPAITISHETGSGAHEVARRLAELMQAGGPKGASPWTVFDRQLVEQMLKENHLPARLAKYMPEDRRSYISDVLDEVLGLHPPSWVLVPQLIESILHLADAGHVILVGRGASFITARMPNVFHVRLVGSLARRIERVQSLEKLSAKEAAKFIARSDRGRNRYVRAYFHARAGNDLFYHIVINTDSVPLADAAELIARGARMCFSRTLSAQKAKFNNAKLAA